MILRFWLRRLNYKFENTINPVFLYGSRVFIFTSLRSFQLFISIHYFPYHLHCTLQRSLHRPGMLAKRFSCKK